MRASDWFSTESGRTPLEAAALRVQPPAPVEVAGAGHPAAVLPPWKPFGRAPTWLESLVHAGTQRQGVLPPGLPVKYAHVLPVGSFVPLPPAKNPFWVGIS